MPRARSSRSSSPLKSLKTTTGQSEYDRIFQNVQEMFSDTVDADVIYFVLSECHWRSEEAIDKLLTIVEKSEASPVKTKSKLQEIAEDVLGPLRHNESQGQGQTYAGSAAGKSTGASFERAIGRPSASAEDQQFNNSSSPVHVDRQGRGGIGQQITSAMSPKVARSMHSVSSDPALAWDFPPLKKELLEPEKSKTNNQKDTRNLPGTESWRAIKAPKSLRNSSSSPHQQSSIDSEISSSGIDKHDEDGVFSDDPNAVRSKLDKPVRPRLEMNRNFPVRLLSKSPEELHEKITFPQTLHHSVSESVLSKKHKNIDIAQPESFELDETVIKCISEINNELLDETEKKTDKGLFSRSRSSSIRSQTSENETGSTGASTPDPSQIQTSTPSTQPMTLPVIGLSVEAPEFVPRPKKTKLEETTQSISESVASVVSSSTRSSPLSATPLKVDTKPTPVSSPHQSLTPAIRMGSPRIAVVSPGCAISPPSNIPVTNSAHLTGSPMFITPKWRPIFPGMYPPQQPPPPLQPRLVAQQLPQQLPQHFSQGYRYPQPATQFPAYSGVVYPVGARPVFRVAGLPPRLPQVPMPQGVQVVSEINDMVAMATGQPIMATRETVHTGVRPTGIDAIKAVGRDGSSSLNVCIETVKALMKSGKKILVIVRGLPGSGKSTLARTIQFDGVVLSTDDYFTKGDIYEYDPVKLTEGHQWNRERAKEAIKMGTSPIIIDNTNTQKWEFKPYVSMALNNNYHVEIMEPDTPWKFKPKELAKRTIHGVPEDQIQRMLSRYEKNLTVALVSNKGMKPVTNGSSDLLSQNSRKENSPSPAVEKKPLKSARAEAARRSRSRGKSNKTKDSKSVRKTQSPASNGPVLGKSDTNEPNVWQISKEDKVLARQTLSPNSVQSFEHTNASLVDDWTADDWPELNEANGDFIICEKSETDNNLEVHTNSDLTVATSSGRSSVCSIQGEVNVYPHSNMLSTTSSKTSSPIIEYDIIESYNQTDRKNKTKNLSESEDKSDFVINRMALKDMEIELGIEVLGYVNEVMQEHSSMNLSELSKEDKERIEEELKALLQFYPIEDEEQRRKAEILIGLKLNQGEIEHGDATTSTENISAHQFTFEEKMNLGVSAMPVVNGFGEDIEMQLDEDIASHKLLEFSHSDVDAERVSDGSIDLDNSLNKEVANILNGSNLYQKITSEICENVMKEALVTENKFSNLKQTEYLDKNTRSKQIQDNENDHYMGKNNSFEINDEGQTKAVVNNSVQENFSLVQQPLENDLIILSESFTKHSNQETVLKSSINQESIYEVDSAIIRAETSDFGETESLFENDSAIIAVSTDSLDKDSVYENDSAIIAASTDVKDTDNLNVYETDSAIIAASKDLLDTKVVVDDADVMKRLKASVEELKYWGHIETEEDQSECLEMVTTEWDECQNYLNANWQNDINFVSSEAKPQRKRKHKSDLNYDEEHVCENAGSNKMEKTENKRESECDNTGRKKEQDSQSQNEAEILDYKTLTDNAISCIPQSLSGLNVNHNVILESNSYAQSCYNNNNEIYNDIYTDTVEPVNFDYAVNIDTEILHEENSEQSQNKSDIPDTLLESKQNLDGSETGLHFNSSGTDLENSIFVSDDEDNLDNSQISKSDSEIIKTTNSDDNIFISDDDMDYLTGNLKVDGLQTDTIHEETILDSDIKTNVEAGGLPANNEVHSMAKVKTDITNKSLKSAEMDVNDNKTVLSERIETPVKHKESCIDEKISSGDKCIAGNSEKSSESDFIPLLSSSEVSIDENGGAELIVDKSDTEYSAHNHEVHFGQPAQKQHSPKKHKLSKSRMAAKLSKPFFDISDTEKFASNDWNTFSAVFNKSDIFKPNSHDTDENIDYKSQGTLTESGDFRILNLFCQEETVEYLPEYKFVKSRSRSFDMSNEEDGQYGSELKKSRNFEVRKIDKSSSTEDLKTDSDIENIQFLKTCFPNISEDELDCVLINCASNVEWALNLLLDWKYHLDYTDEEKESFAKEISKCKRCSSPQIEKTFNETDLERNPDSLLDLCFKKIEVENIATRVDLEKQLIQTGKERLDRIEDDNITKIRLRRSTSLSESSFDRSSVSASHSLERVVRSVSDPHQNRDNVFQYSGSKIGKNAYPLKDIMISPEYQTTKEITNIEISGDVTAENVIGEEVDGLIKSSSNSMQNRKVELDQHCFEDSAIMNDSVTEENSVNEEVNIPFIEQARQLSSPGPVVFTLALDTSILSQLELLFGPVGENSITGHDNLDVPVNLETARLLHQCVKHGLQDDRHLKYKQMKEDEEYARKLQEEQDRKDSQDYQSPSKRTPGSRRGQRVSLAELAEQRTAPPPVLRREPVKPLVEIMEEEKSKQETREQLQKFLESEGGHAVIATRMKRQKLYESFPTIDKTLLDQIFQANCYNLSETMESVQTSLSYQPVQTVMTKEMEEEYDRNLIETMMRQSAGGMLDTLDPFSEDYEDAVDAQYEDYRGEATLHHRLRQECFQKAQEAYRKGLKQVASFYSQQGHLHTQKLKEANVRASEQILEDRHGDLETKMTLDLHGLHVDEAIAALDKILPEKEKERYKSHLTIITGRGRHSHHGVPRLRRAVLAYLQKHQYSFTELHPGAFRVTLKNR